MLANTHVHLRARRRAAAGGAVARRSLLALPLPLARRRADRRLRLGRRIWTVSGLSLALVAGAAYAAFQLFFDRSIRLAGGIAWPLFAATAGAACSALAAAIVSGEELVPPLSGQAWMLLLALGPQTLGWLLIAHGVVRPARVRRLAACSRCSRC